jgi:hypothetical protein
MKSASSDYTTGLLLLAAAMFAGGLVVVRLRRARTLTPVPA